MGGPSAGHPVSHRLVGAVLVGGRSRRFGRDKALADAAGQPLAAVVVDALRRVGADPVVAVGGTAGASLGLPTIADRHPGEGPLAALATVLLWARTGRVLVTPCDLPLVTAEHLRTLVEGAGPDRAAVAEIDGRPEPSLACWPARYGPALLAAVAGGARAWRTALDVGPWTAVPLPAVALADADTPGQLDELLGRATVEGGEGNE
ncbi:MAG: molybdenum cofactor guanylyltransferase [Acidimicrobiales bacterium]